MTEWVSRWSVRGVDEVYTIMPTFAFLHKNRVLWIHTDETLLRKNMAGRHVASVLAIVVFFTACNVSAKTVEVIEITVFASISIGKKEVCIQASRKKVYMFCHAREGLGRYFSQPRIILFLVSLVVASNFRNPSNLSDELTNMMLRNNHIPLRLWRQDCPFYQW